LTLSLPLTTLLPVVLSAFLASMVELTEAFTVVLAVAVACGWRPALGGTVAGLVVLAALVAIFGPLLELVPLGLLQFVIGALLVLFGLRWLRKAILRAAGLMPLHDERIAYAHETAALNRRSHGGRKAAGGGVTAFNAVLVEGLEVVFIVIAVGAGRGMLPYAALGAAIAAVLMLVVGAVLARPLTKVPENVLKFVVGLMLTAFGIFWTGEGLGVPWPGDDLSLAGIFVAFVVLSAGAVRWLRPQRRAQLRVVK
jgi:uncharacterized membrane protein